MDWIKIRSDIDKCYEVVRLSQTMQVSRMEAVGMCVTFWAWVDHATDDGHLPDCTPDIVDAAVGVVGLASGLMSVGWLVQNDGDMLIPNFSRHMGASAKKRALHTWRQERYRAKKGVRNAL